MYAVMMPFFGMGGDHRAESWLGEPGTVDTENFNEEGTENEMLKKIKRKHLSNCFQVKLF